MAKWDLSKLNETSRVRELEDALREIRDIAKLSEGGEFYVMLVDKVLGGTKDE